MCVVLIPYNWQYEEMLVACEKKEMTFWQIRCCCSSMDYN